MPDVLTREQRHLNMSRIRGKDTKPEMLLRHGLHALGFRYVLHQRALAGCPDLAFPRYKAVIFVHGCFWHGHDCHLFKVPGTRTDFWLEKIARNVERDKKAFAALRQEGWRVLTIWECALRGTQRINLDKVLGKAKAFLTGSRQVLQVMGKQAVSSSRSTVSSPCDIDQLPARCAQGAQRC
jgi:DNA mismatch endonuclease, patch repair protein